MKIFEFKFVSVCFVILITASACVSTPGYNKPIPSPTPRAANDPLPPPPPPPPPPTFWGCKVSNNEGRIFKGMATDSYMAFLNAKTECERYYRRCTLLKCASGLPKNWK